MKITIATGPIFPVPAVRGGAVQRLWEGLAREFVKRGHEVTIFAREFPGQAREETVGGIRYVRWGGYEQSTSIRRDLLMCFLYAMRVARKVPRGDVVVTNDFWMPAVLPWLKPSAGKVVVNANRFPKNQYWLYGKAAAFAAASAVVARTIKEQQPGAARRVMVVPNAIDDGFLVTLQAGADREARRAGPTKILYVGRIHPEKGLELLARALRLLGERLEAAGKKPDGWECLLLGPMEQGAGGGGEKFVEEIKGLTAGLPLRFLPPVYEPDALAAIYEGADLFVYPSVAERGESFGIAPLEAMARGVVPVVSGLEVFREYIEPGVNGMVFDHRSAEAAENLASALSDLIGDADKRRRMGAAARATAEKFSPAAIAHKYLQLFEKVLTGNVA